MKMGFSIGFNGFFEHKKGDLASFLVQLHFGSTVNNFWYFLLCWILPC